MSGATLKNDFVEIINHTGAPIDLTGWSVQIASAGQANWQRTNLTNFVLQPGQYYLVQQSQGAGGTDNLPTPDAIGGGLVSSTSGKVALVSNQTTLTANCPVGGGIIDFVGYGTETCAEGSPASILTNTTANCERITAASTPTTMRSTSRSEHPIHATVPAPVSPCTALFGIGSAQPSTVLTGNSTTLTVDVSPAQNPASTGINVTADLSSIGGSATQSFTGVGNTFTFVASVPVSTTPGPKNLAVTITDAQARSASATIFLTVQEPHVTISQIYGGGGNASATFNHDFVELFNPTANTVDLTGWSLQYTSAAGDSWDFTSQPIGGFIEPGQYYLIALAGGATGANLPAANINGDINMSATTGKVALVNDFEPLEGQCPLGDVNIVDFVGYGTGATCAETANAPAPSNTTAIFRQTAAPPITTTIKPTSLRPLQIHGALHRSWRLVQPYFVAILARTASTRHAMRVSRSTSPNRLT
jgi:predicted extracellular nuclease